MRFSLSPRFLGFGSQSVLPSEDGAKLVREWKNNRNNNVVELMSATTGEFTRIFTQAAIQGDPEVNLSTDGTVEIEFRSNPAQ